MDLLIPFNCWINAWKPIASIFIGAVSTVSYCVSKSYFPEFNQVFFIAKLSCTDIHNDFVSEIRWDNKPLGKVEK